VSFGPEVPVVLGASASWETPAPVNCHQVALRLADRGHRVLFVESTGLRTPSPLGSSHDLFRMVRRVKGFLGGVRQVAPNLQVLSPVALPGIGSPSLRELSMRWLGRAAAGAARRSGLASPVLWAFLPTYLRTADDLDPSLVVYHCVDAYAGNPGVDAAWVEEVERRMLRRADLVFATSPVLAERLRAARPDVELVPNVADVELFGRAVTEELPEPPELRGLPPRRAVYVGNLAAYRIDFDQLLALARSHPELQLLLIGVAGMGDVGAGPRSGRELLALPNVTALGPRAQDDLPAYLRHCQVALIPFLDNGHTRASLPLKLWEYLAAGLAVVATDLPNFRALAEEGLIRTARDPQGFAHAVAQALADPPERRAERLARARRHDWRDRMEVLCSSVGRALDSGSERPR
jgi:glycosyltransferase involved in cell wall biosynthesis